MNEMPSSGEYTAPQKSAVHFTARDWCALAMAVALSLLWFWNFGFSALSERVYIPSGLGTMIFVFALFGAEIVYLGKKTVWNKTTALLLAACLLMAVNCFVYISYWVAAINCLIIFCVGTMEIFALSGRLDKSVSNFRVIGNTISLGLRALFINFGKPFRALGTMGKGKRKSLLYALIGIVIALPVLILVISLLSSADAVFRNVFSGLGDWLKNIGIGAALRRVIRTAVLALMFFSSLYFLAQPRKEKPGHIPGSTALPAIPYIIILTLLNVLYALFVAIQFAFLFGNRETAAMNGGYAEYARSGFFQLTAVAIINLAAVLLTSVSVRSRDKIGAAVKLLSILLVLFTAVILASAAYRMSLYVSTYGLSVLRLLTFWAMAVIALLLAAATVKIFKKNFRFWPVLLSVVLACWLIFSWSNPDARIAEFNVDMYLGGAADEIDLQYLSTVSPETLPALERLYASGVDIKASGDSIMPDGRMFLCDVTEGIRSRLSATMNIREATVTALKYAMR